MIERNGKKRCTQKVIFDFFKVFIDLMLFRKILLLVKGKMLNKFKHVSRFLTNIMTIIEIFMLPVLSHCTRSDIIFDFPFPYSIKFTQTAKNSQFPTKKYGREKNEQQTSKNQIKYTFASFFKIK